MALRNILKPTSQVQNGAGDPLAGGIWKLFIPGTTTFITAYRDSGLVVPYTQPIRLSGSGRAEIWISRDCDLVVEDRNGNLIVSQDNANPDALGVEESGGLVPNGSFEIDEDADLIPDGWTLAVSEPGSTNELDTSESTDGGQSFAFTSTGAGGGQLVTTDFFPVNDVDDLRVNFDIRATVAAVRNIFRIEWYDASLVFISNSDVYDSTANPTVFTSQLKIATPPALARFAKCRIIGIDPSVALAGVSRFDRVQIFYPAVVAGVFDNITIQNNEIITTNTNGDLNLRPNGTGSVVVDHDGAPVARSGADSWRVLTDIVTATPPALEAVTGSFDIYDQDNDDALARFGFQGSNILNVINRMRGGSMILSVTDAAGATKRGTAIEPDGSLRVFHPDLDTEIARSIASGMRLIGTVTTATPPVAEAVDTLLELYDADNTDLLADFGYQATNVLQMRNRMEGGPMEFEGIDVGGTDRIGMGFDPDAEWSARYAGIQRLLALASGDVGVKSNLSTDTENRRLTLLHQDGTLRALFGFTGDDDLRIENVIDGGDVTLRGFNAATEARTFIKGDPDSDVEISHPASDAIVARTLTPAQGGLEIDNQNTGAGFQRVLTTFDRSIVSVVLKVSEGRQNDVVLSDITDFSVGVFSARGQYWFRCVLFITTAIGGLTPGLRMRANLSGTGADLIGVITEYDATSIINNTVDPDTELAGISLSATSLTKKIVYEGGFSSVDAAQTFSIQVAQNLTTPTIAQIEAGSFFEVWQEQV